MAFVNYLCCLFKFTNYRPNIGSQDFMYQNISLSALASAAGEVDNICMMIYDVIDVADHKKQLEALQLKISGYQQKQQAS